MHLCIGIGAACHKQRYNVHMVVYCCFVQWPVPFIVPYICVCTSLKQQAGDLRAADLSSKVQCCIAVLIHPIYVLPKVQQPLHSVQITFGCAQLDGGAVATL